jgi:GDPmannose 4,6-dehydratase
MSASKTALICGISGQDGAYLAKLLLDKGYTVYGTSRDAQFSTFKNLMRLGIKDRVQLCSMALTDFRSVLQVLSKTQPDEVYNLAGQTSVGLSFEQPVEALDSIATGTLNLLEVIRFLDRPIRFFNAGSTESFGDTGEGAADEQTPFRPRSPYGVAKATAFWEVANYREAYGLFACSGILSNHDSPLRPERFVTQKIVAAARRIAHGSDEVLQLGNTAIQRDWGWAPEYVEAMHLMMMQPEADDFVIATGQTTSLNEFVEMAFEAVGLDWRHHVQTDAGLFRPTDIAVSRVNPAKAKAVLGWQARSGVREIIRGMMDLEANPQHALA